MSTTVIARRRNHAIGVDRNAPHVEDQPLLVGYTVRGTARDVSEVTWMQAALHMRYGTGKIEAVNILSIDGAYGDVGKGAVFHLRFVFVVPQLHGV